MCGSRKLLLQQIRDVAIQLKELPTEVDFTPTVFPAVGCALSLTLQGLPDIALEQLQSARSSSASSAHLTDMERLNLRSVLVQALCKHPSGPERLLEAYSLPGPPLAPDLQQQAVQVLASAPGKLEAAYQLAAAILDGSAAHQPVKEGAQVLVALWRAAVVLPNDARAAELVVAEVLKRVHPLAPSTWGQLLVTSWQAPEPQQHLYQQLVEVVKQHTTITARLLHTAWQGLGQSKLQVQAWAIEEVLPVLRAATASSDAQERRAASTLLTQLAEALLHTGQGSILLQQYNTWVKDLGLRLGRSSLLQLMQQVGISQAPPVLMGGVAESHGRVDSNELLQALLEAARTPSQDSEDVTALLGAAAEVLTTADRALSHDVYTAALEATAVHASRVPESALCLGQAALTKAIASGQKPTPDMAAACAYLAEHSTVSAAWLGTLDPVLSSYRPATALNWYRAVNQQLQKLADNSLPVSPLLACLSAAEQQGQHTDATTLAGLIQAGLAVAGRQPEGPQLVLQAVANAQQQDCVAQTMAHLASEHRSQLAHILVEQQRWELAIAASHDDSALQHILHASATCQLPPAAVLAVLNAAVAAHNCEVTAVFLHGQVLQRAPQHSSDLVSGITDVAVLEPVCKLLLSTAASKIHGSGTAGGALLQAEQQQHEQQRSTALSLMHWVVAGGGLISGKTWGRLLELYAQSLSAHPEAASLGASHDLAPLASLRSLYSQAASRIEPSEAVTWHLQTALQLAAVPGCASVAAACLEVRIAMMKSGRSWASCGHWELSAACFTSAFVQRVWHCRI
jgi:hypothetical protein